MNRFQFAPTFFASRVGRGYSLQKITQAIQEGNDDAPVCDECGEAPEFCVCSGEMPANPLDIYQFKENRNALSLSTATRLRVPHLSWRGDGSCERGGQARTVPEYDLCKRAGRGPAQRWT